MNGIDEKRLVMDRDDITRRLDRIAYQIWEKNAGTGIAIIGIHSRGVSLANRLVKLLETISGQSILSGTLDIGLYRDDIGYNQIAPVLRDTQIDFDIDGRNIVLVDDVLYTGRTIRAALNALMDMGRPNRVELMVLVDRGHRELPIQADYIGGSIDTGASETVQVNLLETDDSEGVYVMPKHHQQINNGDQVT
jgi:pyrimidine operon attenuation protein/uracil phosphoribosyltransferase